MVAARGLLSQRAYQRPPVTSQLFRVTCLVYPVVLVLCWPHLVLGFFSSDINDAPVYIEPDVVEVEQRYTFDLYCTVAESHRDQYNISDMYFKKHEEYRLGHPYFHMISEYKARLHVPAADYIVWHGVVMCDVDAAEFNIMHTLVNSAMVIFRKDPLTPQLDSCVVDNWESLRCTWSPSKERQGNHVRYSNYHFRYKFLWSKGNDSHTNYCCNNSQLAVCPADNRNLSDSCLLTGRSEVNPFSMGEVYRLTVRAETENSFLVDSWGNGTGFNTWLHVKPSNPTNLRAQTINSTHSLLSWSRPQSSWGPADNWTLDYSITVTSSSSQPTPAVFYTTKHVFLVPVHPYTTWTVTMTTRPVVGGHWSDPVTYSFSTPARAPTTHPAVLTSGYLYEGDCNTSCPVRFFWKPLVESQQNGPDFKYEIREVSTDPDVDLLQAYVTSLNATIPDPDDTVSDMEQGSLIKSLDIPRNGVYVTVTASNDNGAGPNDTGFIHILPRNRLLPVSETLVVEGSEQSNIVHAWIDHSARDTAANYAVVWQIKSQVDTLDWFPLVNHEGKFVITQPIHRYRFGLTKTIGEVNSGIAWKDNCVFASDRGAVVEPPHHVKILTSSETSLTVVWAQPPYNMRAAYIQRYVVYFCVKNTTSNSCLEPVRQHVQWFPNTQRGAELTGLPRSTDYIVNVTSQTARGGESVAVPAVGEPKTLSGISPGMLIGIVFGSVLGLAIGLLGGWTYFKKCRAVTKYFEGTMNIRMPDENRHRHLTSTSSETPFLNAGYMRQSSVVSDTSVDSGQFSTPSLSDCHLQDQNGYSRVTIAPSPNTLTSIPEDDDVFIMDDAEDTAHHNATTYKLSSDADDTAHHNATGASSNNNVEKEMPPQETSAQSITDYAAIQVVTPNRVNCDTFDTHQLQTGAKDSTAPAIEELFGNLNHPDSGGGIVNCAIALPPNQNSSDYVPHTMFSNGGLNSSSSTHQLITLHTSKNNSS